MVVRRQPRGISGAGTQHAILTGYWCPRGTCFEAALCIRDQERRQAHPALGIGTQNRFSEAFDLAFTRRTCLPSCREERGSFSNLVVIRPGGQPGGTHYSTRLLSTRLISGPRKERGQRHRQADATHSSLRSWVRLTCNTKRNTCDLRNATPTRRNGRNFTQPTGRLYATRTQPERNATPTQLCRGEMVASCSWARLDKIPGAARFGRPQRAGSTLRRPTSRKLSTDATHAYALLDSYLEPAREPVPGGTGRKIPASLLFPEIRVVRGIYDPDLKD